MTSSTLPADVPLNPEESEHEFPREATLEAVLQDYLRRADRMTWSPYDLVEQEKVTGLINKSTFTAEQLSAVKTVLFVEDHLPGYLAEYLRILTNPDVKDEQHSLNRKVLRFTFRWVGEEDRHSHVLERYLVCSGLMAKEELDAEMTRERRLVYQSPYEGMLDSFVYLAMQEKATHLYYKAIAKDIQEPILKMCLTRMGADEASHSAFFYDLLLEGFKGNLDALTRRVTAVANQFKMPVQSNLTNYRRQVLNLMRAAPSYKHPDVLGDMMTAIDKASKKFSTENLQLIAPAI